MNLKADNQKLVVEGNESLKKMEKEMQKKQEIVETVKTEMALLQERVILKVIYLHPLTRRNQHTFSSDGSAMQKSSSNC